MKHDIPNHRQDTQYLFWNEDYDEYCELKNRNIGDSYLVPYLMLISNDSIVVVIDIKKKNFLQNGLIKDLFINCGVDETHLGDETNCIIIKDGGNQTAVINSIGEKTEIKSDAGY